MSTAKTREDIERKMWRQASWQVDQDDVDAVLAVVDEVIAAAVADAVRAALEERTGAPLNYAAPEAAEIVAAEDADALDLAYLDAEPDAEAESEETGEGAAESPSETLTEASTGEDPRECATGAETGVQRVHLSGELTLRLIMPEADACTPDVAPEPVAEPVAETPVKKRGAIREAAPMRTEGPGPKRTCRKCEGTYLEEDFPRDRARSDGRKVVCRMCDNARRREQKRAQREARAAKAA